ncbi:8-oxo-dGTP diphosphatase [Paenibacillaceae bacterium]|nr:8-oxo-dGTP diphosphatase [Paenibacillaceae bacterium]
MLKFTICFIKQGSKILLLNREFPAWMGVWNGVGGKLEGGESARESIIREIYEETGLSINNPQFKGIASWIVNEGFVDGMYLFVAELPMEESFDTPIKTYEGILDWKEYEWIIHPKNAGLTSDIPKYIKHILFDEAIYEHRCFYKDGKLIDHELIEIDKSFELLENKKQVEEVIISR